MASTPAGHPACPIGRTTAVIALMLCALFSCKGQNRAHRSGLASNSSAGQSALPWSATSESSQPVMLHFSPLQRIVPVLAGVPTPIQLVWSGTPEAMPASCSLTVHVVDVFTASGRTEGRLPAGIDFRTGGDSHEVGPPGSQIQERKWTLPVQALYTLSWSDFTRTKFQRFERRWSENALQFATGPVVAPTGDKAQSRQPRRTRYAVVILPQKAVELAEMAAGGNRIEINGAPVLLAPVQLATSAEPADSDPRVAYLKARGGYYPEWARPDPTSPMEAYRRTLYVRKLFSTDLFRDILVPKSKSEAAPDDPPIDNLALEAMAHYQLTTWRTAIDRLRSFDPAIVDSLNSMLARKCHDGDVEFACWPADPDAMFDLNQRLTAPLVSTPGSMDAWRDSIADWIANQPVATFWIVAEQGDQMRLAGANFTDQPITVTPRWIADQRNLDPFTMAPGSIMRTIIDRSGRMDGTQLELSTPGHIWKIQCALQMVPVAPPGLTLNEFWKPWTLPAWLNGEGQLAPSHESMTIQRSPVTGKWELVFILDKPVDVREADPSVPDTSPAAPPIVPRTLAQADKWEDLTGSDAITVFVGAAEHPLAVMSIDARTAQVQQWETAGGVLTATINPLPQRADQWIVRIELPDSMTRGEVLDLGVLRTTPDTTGDYSFPRPVLPWTNEPGRLRLDLSRWSALP